MYDKAYYDRHKNDQSWMDRRNKRQRESYVRHRDKRIADMAKRRATRHDSIETAKLWGRRRMLSEAKGRAKKKGITFTLNLSDISSPDICPVFGTPLDWFARKPGDHNPSLDRFDIARGYVPDNVWVISRRANTIKNNATLSEIELLASVMGKKAAGRLLDGREHSEWPAP